MDDVFKALADPNRRLLLDRLNQRNGQTLRDLCDGLAMTRQSVSKHLAVLEKANLVTATPRGRERVHVLNPVPINAIAERWMTQFDRARTAALADLKLALEHPPMDNRFVYTTYIKTTPDQLWTALTEPAFTKRYWGVSLLSDWKVGSRVVWDLGNVTIDGDNQVVLASDPPRHLSYTWHEVTAEFMKHYGMDDQEFFTRANAERRTKVTFELEPMGELVKLTVTHDDADEGSVILEGVSQGWPTILASLKTLLETGEPLTFA
jgi:uncharacterized protein YndB with AHSA1/START domain